MSENNSVDAAAAAAGRTRAVGTVVIISSLIVVLALLAGWFLFFRGGSDADERAAYDAIMRHAGAHQVDSLGEALEDYLDTYNSDAFHFSQLKELNDRLSVERADWQATEAVLSVDALHRFLDIHPDGFYRENATRALDSLAFADVLADNSREAYEQYLSQNPQSVYAVQARQKLDELDKVELTAEEQAGVRQALQRHFDALAANDAQALLATLAPHVGSYIGKADPENEDILAYMAQVHAAHRHLVFSVGGAKVAKVEAASQSLYNIQFTLSESTYAKSPAAEEETDSVPAPLSTKRFKGAAVFNSALKLTSLVLRN